MKQTQIYVSEAGHMTYVINRYGCFLPNLTGLATDIPMASLTSSIPKSGLKVLNIFLWKQRKRGGGTFTFNQAQKKPAEKGWLDL